MEFHNTGGDVDFAKFTDYVLKQFGKDMKQTLEARDELAKRQGAMTAVNDAIKAKADADVYADGIRATADAMQATSAEFLATAKAKDTASNKRQKDLDKQAADFAARVSVFDEASAARERKIRADQETLDAHAADISAQQTTLRAEQSLLNARVKAFQDKVMALTA